MGKSKSTSSQSQESTSVTKNTPSEWENQFNPTLLDFWKSQQPMISGVTGAGGALAQSLLAGNQLPGAYGGGTGLGATPYGIDENAQNAIVNESMRGLPTSLQATGMLDSGASQALYTRGKQNVLSNVAQFNTGAQQNAMQLGSGIGTAAMQPAFSSASMLTSLLPGLRTITNQSNSQMNSQQTYQQPLAQTIGQLSSAFGTGTGGGNLMGTYGPQMQSGMNGLMAQMGNLLGGMNPQQASMAGTTPGSLGGNMAMGFQGSGGGSGGGSSSNPWSDPGTYVDIAKTLGPLLIAMCWVASEIFGGWYHPKTMAARIYISQDAPVWFRNLYIKYGKAVASFIKRNPAFKVLLAPIFEVFAILGLKKAQKVRSL